MKIIITGSESFIGKSTIQVLKQHGHQIVALRHSYTEEQEQLPERADAWIHFAWAGGDSASKTDIDVQEYDLDMSVDVLKKAIELGCGKFVFAGSYAEYGLAQNGKSKQEYGPCEPVSEYGRAKYMFNELASSVVNLHNQDPACRTPIKYVHMRTFSVYGPGDHSNSLISKLVNTFSAGQAAYMGPCTQLWNYIYVDDAARAVALLCESDAEGIYNIASTETKPLKDYVQDVYEAMNCQGSVSYNASCDNVEGESDLSPDTARLQELGFVPEVDFRTGIRRVIEAKEKKDKERAKMNERSNAARYDVIAAQLNVVSGQQSKEIRQRRLLDAIEASGKSMDEILAFLNSGD